MGNKSKIADRFYEAMVRCEKMIPLYMSLCEHPSQDLVDAGARGFCSSNPAALIKSQLAKSSYGHRPAITKSKDLAQLLRAIETLECDLNTINSLRLLAMLFVRNGDLRRMRWDELNLEAGRWQLKPLKGQGKVNMVKDMVVPLPHQAVAESTPRDRDGNFEPAPLRKQQIHISGLDDKTIFHYRQHLPPCLALQATIP